MLSQLHRHKEALSHAQVAISISHYLIKDFHRLTRYYVKRLQDPSMDENIELKAVSNMSTNPNSQRMGISSTKENVAMSKNMQEDMNRRHVDFLYDSQMSLLAKTAIKILPIAEELENKLVSENLLLNESIDETSDKVTGNESNIKAKSKHMDEFNTTYDKVDMRNLLGYLNQSDWIWSLNIGNIMQISPLTMQDIYTTSSIEYELSRELVLEKI